ncbi:MAG: M23 family metallopeptidase [Candidatus Aerophobetes bacterium]|nr:M23 family metallopeptidase [Candidatus Aerophobetes bacterium]
MKKGSFFTLMLIPHSGTKVRRFNIPKSAFFTIIIIIGVAFAVLSFFVNDYLRVREEVKRTEELKKINQFQKEKILSLAEKVNDFNQRLKRLKELEIKVRELAGVGGEGFNINKGGLGKGGPESYIRLDEDEDIFSLVDSVEKNVVFLRSEAGKRKEGLEETEEVIQKKRELFASTPNIFPIQGWISSGFGWRKNPFSKKREFHSAIDIVAPWGTEVRAAAQGKVIFAGWKDGYGLSVKIKDGYGYETVYGHFSRILVKRDSWVKKGEIIGRVGSTGRSTGPHLHFEVWHNRKAVNPLNLMVEPLG